MLEICLDGRNIFTWKFGIEYFEIGHLFSEVSVNASAVLHKM